MARDPYHVWEHVESQKHKCTTHLKMTLGGGDHTEIQGEAGRDPGPGKDQAKSSTPTGREGGLSSQCGWVLTASLARRLWQAELC